MSGSRILVLTRHYAPEPTGSAPPMQQLAEWLAAQGLATEVVTSRPTYPQPRVLPGYERGQHDRAVEKGVHVRRLPTWPARGAGLLARALPEARFMGQLLLARASGRLAPSDRLISLCPSILTVLAALPYRMRGGRHVVVVHDIQSGLGAALGSPSVKAIVGVLRALERWTLNRADHLIVLSQAMADALTEIGVRTPVTILPPQVDCRTIHPLPRPHGSAPVLMYSGNLGRKQGLDQLLDLAAVLRTRAPDVIVRIRGDGAMKADIEARITAEALTNVELLPLVPADRIAQSLAEGDIHLVPQIAEGGDFAVPSKAFAIMAAGRPFITTATQQSSIARLAEESGAFLLVPPRDPHTFADAVIALLNDGGRRETLAARGRDYALRVADTDVVMRRTLNLLQA